MKDAYPDQVATMQNLVAEAAREASSFSAQVGSVAALVQRNQRAATSPFDQAHARDAVLTLGTGQGTPESLHQAQPANDYNALVKDLSEALAKSSDPLERDRLGQELTRAQLRRAHGG